MQYFRSLIFVGQMYFMMFVLALYFTPWAIVDKRGATAGIRTYCRYVRWSAAWMVGLKSEVRGTVPEGEILVASKHQSFFDIIILCSVLERPKFIMKSSLRYAPILGWYALRIGCVPVERGKRREAMQQMKRGVAEGKTQAGQLIIYPQGTRVGPGVDMPYKVGAAVLYEETGQSCALAATNVGVFWPRTGIFRKPGLAVVEFLAPIEPGLGNDAFLAEMETRIEAASDQLLVEAGFTKEG